MHEKENFGLDEMYTGPLVSELLEVFYPPPDPEPWRGKAEIFEHRSPDGENVVMTRGD